MENQIIIKNVYDLLSLANMTSDPSDPSKDGSQPVTRSAALKGGLKEGYDAARDKLKRAFSSAKEDGTEDKAVPTVINWIVKVVNDLIMKVNAQGDMLKDLVEDLRKSPRDSKIEELEKMFEAMKKKEEDTEKSMKEFETKHDELEKM